MIMGDVLNLTSIQEEQECKKKYVLYVEGYPTPQMVEALLDLWYAMGNEEPLNILPDDMRLEVVL